MPTDVTSISSTPLGIVPAATRLAAAAKKSGSELDQDAFLKLLVAQLKYQDPSKPVDSSEFMSQTAQFTQVQKLTEMATSTADLLAAQRVLGGSALIGRTVTYVGTDGKDVSGVVTAASFSAVNGATVRVGTAADAPSIAMNAITRITETPASTA